MNQPVSRPTGPQAKSSWLWLVLVLLLASLATTSLLDQRAETQYQAALQRALVTFGLARTLNGVISVLQGTEIALEPAGVGVTFTPGELLDPVNDLIERFSWLMLLSSVSLGVQQTLLAMSGWWGLRLLVIGAAAAVVASRFAKPGSRWRSAALRFFTLTILLRFAMPVVVVANEALYQVFMQADYQAATSVIEQTRDELELMAEPPANDSEEVSWFGSIRNWVDQTTAQIDLRQRVEAFSARLGQATEQLLRLAALFVLQTILLPLLTLWLLVQVSRRLMAWLLPAPWQQYSPAASA